MAALTAAELREHITTALSDDALQLLADAAWEAIAQAAGAEGALTEVYDGSGTYLFLTRPVSAFTSITETVGSTATILAADDYRLSPDGMSVRRLATGTSPQSYWQGDVSVVYVPADDEAQRQVVQIALVRLYVNHHPGIADERIGDWTESFQSNSVWNYAQERDNILATLRAPELWFA